MFGNVLVKKKNIHYFMQCFNVFVLQTIANASYNSNNVLNTFKTFVYNKLHSAKNDPVVSSV